MTGTPELWSVEQAARHWVVSPSRARAILADRKIKRTSGYPADEIKAVILQQGARNDLIQLARSASPEPGE